MTLTQIPSEVRYATTNPKVKIIAKPGMIMLDADALEAIPWTMSDEFPGMGFKVLRVDLDKGYEFGMMKLDRGVQLPVHYHSTGVELFCIKGRFGYYPAGSIGAGGYAWEPSGIVHEPETAEEEETVVVSVSFGATQLYNEDGSLGPMSDTLGRLREARRKDPMAVAHLNLPDSVWD